MAQVHPLRRLVTLLNPRRVWKTLAWFAGIAATIRRRRREPRLTVAVDLCPFGETLTGIGWYLLRTLEALADRDDIRLRLYGPFIATGLWFDEALKTQPPQGRALEFVRIDPPTDLSIPPWRLSQWVQGLQKLLIALDRNQVLFAPNYLIPPHFRRALKRPGGKHGQVVATVHDLGFRKVPWSLEEGTFQALEERLDQTFRQARLLMTDSEAVKQELVEMDHLPPERIEAVHLGPGQLSTRLTTEDPGELPPGTPECYALHVGTLEPRKNLKVLLEAWPRLRRQDPQAPALVLCGKVGWKFDDLTEALKRGEQEGWLHRFGYLENAQLAALYHRAWCVVFPTLYEGFGLPAVEAQSAGTPLLASDIPVLREVAGDGSLYAPPDQPEAWVALVERLGAENGLRVRLIEAGRNNVRRFAWERTADEMVRVFRRAAAAE